MFLDSHRILPMSLSGLMDHPSLMLGAIIFTVIHARLTNFRELKSTTVWSFLELVTHAVAYLRKILACNWSVFDVDFNRTHIIHGNSKAIGRSPYRRGIIDVLGMFWRLWHLRHIHMLVNLASSVGHLILRLVDFQILICFRILGLKPRFTLLVTGLNLQFLNAFTFLLFAGHFWWTYFFRDDSRLLIQSYLCFYRVRTWNHARRFRWLHLMVVHPGHNTRFATVSFCLPLICFFLPLGAPIGTTIMTLIGHDGFSSILLI